MIQNYEEKAKEIDARIAWLEKEIQEIELKFNNRHLSVETVLSFREKLEASKRELKKLETSRFSVFDRYLSWVDSSGKKYSDIDSLKVINLFSILPKEIRRNYNIGDTLSKFFGFFLGTSGVAIIIAIFCFILAIRVSNVLYIPAIIFSVIGSLAPLTFAAMSYCNKKAKKDFENLDLGKLFRENINELSRQIEIKKNLNKLYYENLMEDAITWQKKREEKEKLEGQREKYIDYLATADELLYNHIVDDTDELSQGKSKVLKLR